MIAIPAATQGLRSGSRPPSATGVVLCGGASRRMGRDKALLRAGEQTLLERTAGVLGEVTGTVLLATGREPRYTDLGLPVVCDRLTDAGPLAGLDAALEASGEDYLVVVACDLPRLSARVLSDLLAHAVENELDVCLYETEQGLEPLLGVYRRTCRGPVRSALEQGWRRLVSFHSERKEDNTELRVGTLRARNRDEDVARNVNTPQEWSAVAEETNKHRSGAEEGAG